MQVPTDKELSQGRGKQKTLKSEGKCYFIPVPLFGPQATKAQLQTSAWLTGEVLAAFWPKARQKEYATYLFKTSPADATSSRLSF
jgi:hypothetical protein